jgi:hypothetical protein
MTAGCTSTFPGRMMSSSIGVMMLAAISSQSGIAQSIETVRLLEMPITVQGMVTTPDGSPLSDVSVDHVAVWKGSILMESSIKTTADGHVMFQTVAPAVVFRKKGYESKLVRVVQHKGMLQITLHNLTKEVGIPKCEPDTCPALGFGSLCPPRILGVDLGPRGGSIDAFEETFTIRKGKQLWTMIHGAGPSWTRGLPPSRNIWSSIEYKEQLRHGPGIDLLDASGTNEAGQKWRYVGTFGESLHYFDLEPNVAAVMDLILDRLCLR